MSNLTLSGLLNVVEQASDFPILVSEPPRRFVSVFIHCDTGVIWEVCVTDKPTQWLVHRFGKREVTVLGAFATAAEAMAMYCAAVAPVVMERLVA